MLRLLFTVISVFAIFSDHYTALGGKGVDLPEYPPATNWVGSQGYEKFGSSVAVVPFWRGPGGNDDINGANEYVIGTSNVLTYKETVGGEDVIVDTNSRGYISVHTKNTENGVYTEIPTYLYGTMNSTCDPELKKCVGVPDDWEGNEAGFGSAVAISEQPSSKSLSRFMVAGNPTKAAKSALIFSRDEDNKWPTDKFYIMQVRQNSYAVKVDGTACPRDSNDVPECQCSKDPVTDVPNCQVDIDQLYTDQAVCLNDETKLKADCDLCGGNSLASTCISDAADCCNNPYKTCAATINCTCLTDSDKGKECTQKLDDGIAEFNIGDDNKWAGPYGDSSGPNKWDTLTSFVPANKECGSDYCKIGAEGERTYPGENDGFGNAISIFGDTLAISAMQYMGAQGAVYLYMTADVKPGSGRAEFPPGSPGSDRSFAGNRAVTGNAGNKYNVFRKNYWPIPYMILEGDKQEEGDTRTEHFGQSVCVTTNYIAVGSPQAQGFKSKSGTAAQLVHAGRVFIFARDPKTGWGKINVKILTGARNNGYFGYSVSMTENLSKNNFGTILVGEHQQKGIPTDGNGSGKTVFEGEVSIWNFETVKGKAPIMAAKPDATYLGDTQEGDFGRAVALGATRFAVAGRTNKVWVYGTDELGNWSEDLVAVQTGEGTESEYGMAIATDGKTFVLSTAPTFLTTNPKGDDIVNAGKVYVYYIFEPSVLTVTMIMGIVIFTISMLCFIGVFFRFYYAEDGDAKVIDPKLAAKAARLGFGHHNVGHKHVAHRHGEASREKKFLAPAGKNVTKMSKAPTSHGTSNPLQAGNEMVEEVYGSEL